MTNLEQRILWLELELQRMKERVDELEEKLSAQESEHKIAPLSV